jgi:hypothetical protein
MAYLLPTGRISEGDLMSFRRIAAGLLCSIALAGPGSAADNTPVPDFSGTWGRNTFNTETPDQGPGPLDNLLRLGKYRGTTLVDGDPVPLVGDYNSPILRPETAAVVKKNGEYSQSGHDVPDPSNQCGAYSTPYLFSIAGGMQFLRHRDELLIMLTQDNQVRHVRLNGSHPRNVKPTPMGDAVAHYEGDTLVIDTVGIKVAPYTVADRFGTPQSDAMHVVERYRLIDAKEGAAALKKHIEVNGIIGPIAVDPEADKALRVELTVDDPKMFTMPWHANVTYQRVIRGWAEGSCADNNVDMFHLGDTQHQPTAKTPDF